ncbi:Gfo/Idh/MocA family oxidoreductase [Planctomycetota bacterium]|nr:Gfo/Idh/MocA family oxidoreductase [Planctomycetota bacterium]
MNDKIQMAIVGLRFGQHIVENQVLNGPGAPFINLRGVCDLDRTKSSTLAKKYNLKEYLSLDGILDDPVIEAVGLFTPPSNRANMIRRIMLAGKHVMTTKPFELESDEAFKVLLEAKQLNKIVHLNSPSPLPSQETAQILKWQDDHNLGQPISARWETFTSSCEQADGSWYDDPQQCPVAPIFRIGIYGINQLIRLCGRVESVSVCHSRIRTGRPTPDTAECSLQFESGALGSIFASYCIDEGHLYGSRLLMHYERGTIRNSVTALDDRGETSAIDLHLQTPLPNRKLYCETASIDEEEMSGKYQWDLFYNAVRKNNFYVKGEITPDLIAHAIEVIDAMRLSQEFDKRIAISEVSIEQQHAHAAL